MNKLASRLRGLQPQQFRNGTIECDIREKDVQGQSFVGITFHGVDSTTYDAIYFRPFNFKTLRRTPTRGSMCASSSRVPR